MTLFTFYPQTYPQLFQAKEESTAIVGIGELNVRFGAVFTLPPFKVSK